MAERLENDNVNDPEAPFGRNNMGVPWATPNHPGEGGVVKHKQQTGSQGREEKSSEVGCISGTKASLQNRHQPRAH